jgi:formylglycine-generating enzyme required for sulfatase activity
VSDLALRRVDQWAATVAWTAPGDDGAVGTATGYDVRHSLAAITDASWDTAIRVRAAPNPQAAGSTDSLSFQIPSTDITFYVSLKTVDDAGNWSDLSNVLAVTSPDVLPPGQVQDLAVVSRTTTSVSLTWTAPGDNLGAGRASAYDLRYSTTALSETTWDDAVPVSGLPLPRPAGATETFEVTGLTAGTFYYFALRVADEVPRWSGLSNVLYTPTVPLPRPPETILVPAGAFTMGDGVSTCGEDQRSVTLTRDVDLGRYEVTNQEYLEAVWWAYSNGYVAATATSVIDNLDGSTVEILDLDDPEGQSEIAFHEGIFYLRDAGWGINGDHPVKEVSWYGAAAYCDWLSLIEGRPRAYDHSTWVCNGGDPYGAAGYRLPTEAEWEYAGQFDDERAFPWGNESPDDERANYRLAVGWTTVVGSYPGGPSILGELPHDLAGNVMEWCNDWQTCLLGNSPKTDPPGPAGGTKRVARGGSLSAGGTYLRVADRAGFYEPERTSHTIGFRIVRTR